MVPGSGRYHSGRVSVEVISAGEVHAVLSCAAFGVPEVKHALQSRPAVGAPAAGPLPHMAPYGFLSTPAERMQTVISHHLKPLFVCLALGDPQNVTLGFST